MRLAALIALPLLASSAVSAAEAPFLFDVLRQPKFKTSWKALMKSVQPTPDWLMQFDRDYDGVAGQMVDVTVDGKPYTISFVCKPTDCAQHRFEVIFDADGTHAYGALGGKDNSPGFFGAPSPALQDALSKGIKG